MIWLWIICVAVAAVCKAVADTLDHHFDTSIFRGLPRKWWDPNVVIKSVPQIFGYPLDGWHISNSIQIAAWMAGAVLYRQAWGWWQDIGVGGICFILVFNVFYNKILR